MMVFHCGIYAYIGRYEHIDFLGKPDTSLRYKKCGKSVSSDIEFFRRRDDVLTDLKGATGFRVRSSGLVEGFAQCIGDLSAADCSACLAEAVEELKTLCGSAAAADVFLAQCYARYWASGYYDYSSGPRLFRCSLLCRRIIHLHWQNILAFSSSIKNMDSILTIETLRVNFHSFCLFGVQQPSL